MGADFIRSLRARFYSLAVALLILAGCGGDSMNPVDEPPNAAPAAEPVRVSADWLRAQPGERFGGFSFHLLNADGRALTQWPGVAITEDRADDAVTFSLIAEDGAADDLYLYAVYSGDSWALDEAWLDAARDAEYVFISVPHRIRDVLAVGVARVGAKRGSSLDAGPLAHLRFISGRDSVNKAASAVNDDPRSVVEFQASGGGDYLVADISWKERNIGDYNNNGLVEVADLTPVGIYYEQEVAAADDPELLEVADGNLDGFVTIHDITPIGQNFGLRIDGFRLYAAFTANPQPADFKLYPLPDFRVFTRSSVYDGADALAKKKRLVYSQNELPVEDPSQVWPGGAVSLQVRAYADDGGDITEGPASNTVQLVYGGLPQPPVWTDPINGKGITDAWGDTQNGAAGVWVEFGDAFDVDGDDIYYRIYYDTAADFLLGEACVLEYREDQLEGGPPYRVFIDAIYDVIPAKAEGGPFVRGTDYMFFVTAADGPQGAGEETAGNNPLTAHPPALGESSEPWSHYRGDAQRTGRNPDCTLAEPVEWNELAALPGGSPVEFTQTVISDAGWALASSADGSPQRVDLAGGAATPRGTLNTDEQFYTALSGERIIISNGGQLQSMNYDGSDLRTADVNCGTAPLVLGDLLYVVSEGGDITCLTADRLIEQWRHDLDLAQPPDAVLAPAADNQFVYFAVDQMLFKYYLISGNAANSATLPYPPVGGSLAIDVERGNLYCCVADTSESPNALVQFHTSNMLPAGFFFCPSDFLPTAAPCLALNEDPPVAIVAIGRSDDESSNMLAKYSLNNGAGWRLSSGDQRVNEITCGADRIFLVTDNRYLVFDFSGRLSQNYEIGAINTELALGGASGLLASTGLDILTAAMPDPPPYNLDGIAGIQSLSVGNGEFTANWNSNYIDEHGERFAYAIFYSDEWPVEFDEPRAHTQLAFAAASESSKTVQNLDNGTRYWAGVRAYDGFWGVDENMEQNTVMLAGTPPWQREEIVFDTIEPYFMRGLVDPAGTMHLVFNATDDGRLLHLWGEAGNWEYEEVVDTLWNEVIAQGFEPAWDATGDRLAIAYANQALNDVGYLLRLTDDYAKTVFPDTTPAVNPQVTLAIGDEAALAYTQDIFDVVVESHVDYYLKRTVAGVWQAYEPLEETNLSGRDLDMVLNPADGESPWVALQRGGESAPNRYTPQEGECMYAWWDSGASAWVFDTVDSGDNEPDSDCGKRVQQVLDNDDHPHLAYLDLNSSPTLPRGQLKYAYHDGSTWHVETVGGFDLSYQTGNLQFTWGELGIALADDGAGGQQAVIAMLSRRSGSDPGQPHQAVTEVWVREGANDWRLERLTDAELSFPRDREPCVLLITPDDVWHVFYMTASDQAVWDDADMLVHLWRPVASS